MQIRAIRKISQTINLMEKNIDYTLGFLKNIAIIDSHLLKLNNYIHSKDYFKSTDYSYRIYFMDVQLKKPALEIYFSCELPNLINNQIHTLSMDISIYNENEIWVYDEHIHWNGYDGLGTDEFTLEKEYKNLNGFLENLEQNYLDSEAKYLSVVTKQIG